MKAQALKCNCDAARVRFAKILERDMMFAWTSCSCSVFEFTPRKTAILNLGGAWFALMFLWMFCKELEFSYFVVQPHGFKRKLDEELKSVPGHGPVSCECNVVVFQEILVQGHP